jgi:cysteinyl-tRNA synthetase
MKEFVEDILGLRNDQTSASDDIDDVMNLVIKLRNEAKANKDFVTSDRIRDELNSIGIQLKDSKEGTLWNKI